jgi:O-methyltransferase
VLSRKIRAAITPWLPDPVLLKLRKAKSEWPLFRFKYTPRRSLGFAGRRVLVQRIKVANENIHCPHTHHEIISMIEEILRISPSDKGCIVEAGCFKGGSTAKLSIAAKLVNRKLIVFDSFEGIPENQEAHGQDIFGLRAEFEAGKYCGRLDEVVDNVRRFGDAGSCEFVKGWFEDTMPHFHEPIALAFIDVDLASSTRTCLKYLYPLLIPGATIFSHDGHLPLCIEAVDDDQFWEKEVGFPKPAMPGLGKKKLLEIVKPRTAKESARRLAKAAAAGGSRP